MQRPDYIKLFQAFGKMRVLILGDVMVDSYIWGDVSRISPEAPVPIVAVKKRENRLGGAANVALNIKAMGATPVLCSVVGTDPKGIEFTDLMRLEGMDTSGIVASPDRVTTTKFRVIGNKMQLLRVDEEISEPLNGNDRRNLMDRFTGLLENSRIDVILFQDYDKGVIDPGLIAQVMGLAEQRKIPVTVDPKKRNFTEYRGVSLFKPNLKELREGLNLPVEPTHPDSLRSAAASLRQLIRCDLILITLSEHGIYVDRQSDNHPVSRIIPSHVRSVSDVSGAGDTVISLASLCLGSGTDAETLALVSNLAGGLVCEKVGVVPVDRQQLLEELMKL